MTFEKQFFPVSISCQVVNVLNGFLQASGDPIMSPIRQKIADINTKPTMPIEQWWALLHEVFETYPTPHIGIKIGGSVHPSDIGLLGYLLMNCQTIEHAIMQYSRFEALLHNVSPSFIEYHNEGLTLFWDVHRPSIRLANELMTSGLIRCTRLLTNDANFTAQKIQFVEVKPDDISEYEAYFGCPVLFEQPRQSVSFSYEQVARRITSTDSHLMGLLEQQANALLQVNQHQDAWLMSVQHNITDLLQEGTPTADMIARRVGLSERTFYRYLRYRGATYQSVLKNVRYELSKNYLKDMSLSLSEVAFLLGYSDQGVFCRAFQTWSGTTPLKYRKSSV